MTRRASFVAAAAAMTTAEAGLTAVPAPLPTPMLRVVPEPLQWDSGCLVTSFREHDADAGAADGEGFGDAVGEGGGPSAMEYLTSVLSSNVAIESPQQFATNLSDRFGVNLWIKCKDLQPVIDNCAPAQLVSGQGLHRGRVTGARRPAGGFPPDLAKVRFPAATGDDDTSPAVVTGITVDPDDSDTEHPLHEPQFVFHAVDDERRQQPPLLPIHRRRPAADEERLRYFMILPQMILCWSTLVFGRDDLLCQ